jgi:hypothetical protein
MALAWGRRLNLRHDRNTNRRKLLYGYGSPKGEVPVFVRSRSAVTFATLTVAYFLGGCGADTTNQYFSKPLNLFGGSGYTYAQLDDTRIDRPIGAGDLIEADGGCPHYVPTAPAPPPPAAPANPGEAPPPPPDPSLFSGGVALGMGECEVVSHLGQPTAVNLGTNPNGTRSASLTFNGGPRPGLYRFESGRLVEMDRIAAPPPPPEPEKKKVAKKKPPKPADAPSSGDKS